jgi:hypothetical protein
VRGSVGAGWAGFAGGCGAPELAAPESVDGAAVGKPPARQAIGAVGLRAGEMRGRADAGFWPELAVLQTLQGWAALDPQRGVHHWRDGDTEIDFVPEQACELVGVEVKAAKKVGSEDLGGVRVWQAAFTRKGKVPRAVVLHGGDEARFLGDETWALGLGALLPG